MKHVHLNGFGDPSVITIKESELPKPKENEVLMRIKASALNRADTNQREGKYPAPPGASQILGLEAAGYVCDADGKPDESRRVMALLSGGGCSQYVTVPKDHLIDVPENLSMEEAGGTPEVWLTAFLLLELAKIQKGDRVLIYGGASGVGTTLIQLVKFFEGVSIVTVSTDEKVEFTKKVGADFALNYKKEQDLTKAIQEATEGKGVNIILDCVGAQWAAMNVQVAAVDARWILYGLMSGAEIEKFNLGPIMGKRISLIPSTLRGRSNDYKTELINRFKSVVLPKLADGTFKVYVDRVIKVDWTDPKPIQDAHLLMKGNENSGKIIYSIE